MNKLPTGITGFTSINNYFELPLVDKSLLLKSVTDLTNLNSNYLFTRFQEPNEGNNYYSVFILDKILNKSLVILFNYHYNYFCSLKREISWCEKEFGELQVELVTHFSKYGFNYLSKEVLDKNVTEENLSELSSAEKEEIDYWESKTIGEIIFNHYD